MREKLSLVHGFLQADVQNQLHDLETQLLQKELSEVGSSCVATGHGLGKVWGRSC